MDESLLVQGMTDAQKAMFETEMKPVRKSRGAAFALHVLLGWAGGHHFYMKRGGLGVLYLLLTCIFGGALCVYLWASSQSLLDLGMVGIDETVVFYVLLGGSLLPEFLALIELILVSGRIARYNEARAEEIAIKIKALSLSAAPSAGPAAAPSEPAEPAEPAPAAGADATVMLSGGGMGEDEIPLLGNFVVVSGSDKGKEIPVYGYVTSGGFETTMGREQVTGGRGKAHVHFDDPAISRKQAKLVCSAGKFKIVNLSKTNPTVVNGRSVGVDEGVNIVPGNRVQFGAVEMEFRV